jgi:hypothetical protein
MKLRLFSIIFALSGLTMLAGCGGGGTGTASDKIAESDTCIACHDSSAISSVTKQSITVEFQQSSHYVSGAASCNDCHEKSALHPESCTGCHGSSLYKKDAYSSPMNPDHSSLATADHPEIPAHVPKCFKCHFLPAANFNYPPQDGKTYAKKDLMLDRVRFNHMSTSRTSRANYMPADNATTYRDSCSRCHNPHNNSSGITQAKQWAESGKGNVLGGPWTSNEFRLNNIAAAAYDPTKIINKDSSIAFNQCVRCHTTTGYRNFIGLGDNPLLPKGSIMPFGGPALSQGRETLFCNACHSDYSFARRNTGPVTVFYTLSTNTTAPVKKIRLTGSTTYNDLMGNPNQLSIKFTFKDIGTSNLCLWCHTGRETGDVIKIVSQDPTVSFERLAIILSHYLTGGASIIQSSGYTFEHLDPSRTYPSSGHQNVGGTSRGPCITCHMDSTRHSFEPISTNKINASDFWKNSVKGLTSTCTGCHGSYTYTTVNSNKVAHRAALDAVLGCMTAQYKLRPGQANNIRSITNRADTKSFTKWSSSGASPLRANVQKIKGRDLMGATYNWVALMNDYGSYVHNVSYAKRLIYDTIDLLDDGSLNFSTCGKFEAIGKTRSTTDTTTWTEYNYICGKGKFGDIRERP